MKRTIDAHQLASDLRALAVRLSYLTPRQTCLDAAKELERLHRGLVRIRDLQPDSGSSLDACRDIARELTT